jgi:hypothetical protein
LLALLLAPGAGASHDPSGAPFGEDFVTGTAGSFIGFSRTVNSFDAHSGPSGENPRGTTETRGPRFLLQGTVTCLAVDANRATIGVAIASNPTDVIAGLYFVEDNDGEGQDRLSFVSQGGVAPTVCPSPPLFFTPPPITEGDITVHDAPPLPTSKDQCKLGGWRNFGTAFKNQGQCVAFVDRHPQP